MNKAAKALADLKPNPKNPRKISDKKRQMLQASLKQFGDLGGIVRNRRTNRLVGGHQRRDAFNAAGSSDITIERTYDPATPVGTVAEGFVCLNGERFYYREVDWSDEQEKMANLAANRNAGEFDMPMLSELFGELAHMNLDLDLTMFDNVERDSLVSPQSFAEQSEPTERLDQTKPTICPSCGHEFFKA